MKNLQSPFYAVIIDAGSTGSRVHAFTFHKSILDGSFILDDESFAHVKPGFSSYADEPTKGAESLRILLNKAKVFVPKSKWRSTPFSLKATAGLRLLPKEKADRLLEECEKLFKNSGFLVSEKSVSIMDGNNEGIFSWFTVNFLLNRLAPQSQKNTVAALDLGGGSTQVTFALGNNKHDKNKKEHIFTINIAVGKNVSVYSQSYLGMGLDAARKGILRYGENVDQKDQNSSFLSAVELYSECIHPLISTNWSYDGVSYSVKGRNLTNATSKVLETENLTETARKGPATARFSECLQVAKSYVGTIVDRPLGLENQEIVAFSYYFERAQQVHLIDTSIGGIVTVDAFLQQAMVYCEHPNIEQPFMCLDLTFIYILLWEGLNLRPTTELQLYRKIDNHGLSWALGAAFNILRNGL